MDLIAEAISQVDATSRLLKKDTVRLVRKQIELDLVRAISTGWFKSIRPNLEFSDTQLTDISKAYDSLLVASEKETSRSTYLKTLTFLRSNLVALRSQAMLQVGTKAKKADEGAPDFSALVKDPKMRLILSNRWEECNRCIAADAPLSSVVMMGGILEAILLAKINSYPDKSKIFKSKSAPIDKKTNKPASLQEWTLRNYLDIAHEFQWITKSTKDVGDIIRDYRNYVHPYKEFSHGIKIHKDDSELFWKITKSIILQLLR